MRLSLSVRAVLVGICFAIGIAPLSVRADSTMRISANTPVRSLDPAKFSLGALEYNYALLVYSRLAYFDADLNLIPDLAERWEASPDQKIWTFHLRKGVKFHDGRELDAEDVLATYRRLADPAIGSVIRTSVGLIDTMDAPDPLTVRFTLKIPYSSWPAITAAFQASILPRDGDRHDHDKTRRHRALQIRQLRAERDDGTCPQPRLFRCGLIQV
jgi:peptide/nickel transport system substrate-binding protein